MKRKVLFTMIIAFLMIPISAKGMFEFGLHFSTWNVNMIAPLVEDRIIPEIEYWDPEYGSLKFSSNGNNYGFEFRFFPGGEKGSFSLGVSYERNNFKMRADGKYNGRDNRGRSIKAEASGTIDILPHSFNFSIRWDLSPSKRVHPFIGLGFGFGSLDILIKFHSKIMTNINGVDLIREQDDRWNTEDIKKEYRKKKGEKFPLEFFPIIHINFGLRGKITDNIHLLGEVAVYDGLMFRGGISYRF